MKRRPRVVVVAIIAVVLVVGGALTFWLLSRPSGPGETVAAYLVALERGDGAAASTLSAQHADDAPALAFDALATAREWISAPRTDTLTTQGVDAEATVAFTLAGEQHSATIALSNASGAWLVTGPPAATVSVRSTLGAGVVLGSVVVPFGEAESVTIALLPAVYEVAAAPAGLLEGAQTLVVASPKAREVSLQPVLGAAASEAARAQLTEYLAACTAPVSAVPSACGIRVPWAADLATLVQLKFRIGAPPVLALAPDGSGFAATGGTLVATATGVDDSGAEASFTYRDSEWAVRGSVSLTLDELTLEVW